MKLTFIFAPYRAAALFVLTSALLLSFTLFTRTGSFAGIHSDSAATRVDRPMSSEDRAKITEALNRNAATLKFVKNEGQWNSEILYGISSEAGHVFVESDRLVFENVHSKERHAAL